MPEQRASRPEPAEAAVALDRTAVIQALIEAGCIAAGEEADEPHTEAMARRAAMLLPSTGVAVDLCTGAGAIAAVLAAAVPGARVVATEIEPRAVRCARRNGVEVFDGSLDDPLPPELEHRIMVDADGDPRAVLAQLNV